MDNLKITDASVILHFYNNGLLTKYLLLLDDEELDTAGINVLTTDPLKEKESILELIRNEKAYRYYSNILEGLKEGKTK